MAAALEDPIPTASDPRRSGRGDRDVGDFKCGFAALDRHPAARRRKGWYAVTRLNPQTHSEISFSIS